MFTREELTIMQAALSDWDGPYGKGAKLNKYERAKLEIELDVARALAERFREILHDYHLIEQQIAWTSYDWKTSDD